MWYWILHELLPLTFTITCDARPIIMSQHRRTGTPRGHSVGNGTDIGIWSLLITMLCTGAVAWQVHGNMSLVLDLFPIPTAAAGLGDSYSGLVGRRCVWSVNAQITQIPAQDHTQLPADLWLGPGPIGCQSPPSSCHITVTYSTTEWVPYFGVWDEVHRHYQFVGPSLKVTCYHLFGYHWSHASSTWYLGVLPCNCLRRCSPYLLDLFKNKNKIFLGRM